MNADTEKRDLIRYFRMIVAVAVLSGGALFASITIRHSADLRARDRLENYHLHTLMLTQKIATEVANLRLRTATTEASGGQIRDLATDRKSAIALDSITESLSTIAGQQEQFDGIYFRGTVRRAQARNEDVRTTLSLGDQTLQQLNREFEQLEWTVFQLTRLHTIAVQNLTTENSAASKHRAQVSSLAITGVLIVTALLLVKLLRLVQGRIQAHVETKQALLQRERQLLHSQKLDALGKLVGGVAHDFNNTITAILGNVDVLSRKLPQDAPEQKCLNEIRSAGEQSAALTRRLLMFSRYDIAQPRTVDLNLCLREIEPMLRRLLPASIEFNTHLRSNYVFAQIDPGQFEQMLINLVVNARDAMPDGGQLTMESGAVNLDTNEAARAGLDSGPYCKIIVRDSGCGMPPEEKKRIFEPFFTTKDPTKGTGLGLATVHGITSACKGAVTVESEVGKGTRFDLLLPRSALSVITYEEEHNVSGIFGGAETILVVEDQEQVRNMMLTGLQSVGYNVLASADGEEALSIIQDDEVSVDLVVTDLIMPGMRGDELAGQILDLDPDMPIIFVTGYGEEHIIKSVAASRHPLLFKPFMLEQLIKSVRATLKLKKRTSAGDDGVTSTTQSPTIAAHR